MEPVDRAVPQLRRGTLEFCVLALLRDRERYGFELVRTLSDIDGMTISEGTIYPLLSRLRRNGLVTTTWHDSDAGPPGATTGRRRPDGGRWMPSPSSGVSSATPSTSC
jgi:PadR family transcriptional regulator PadR